MSYLTDEIPILCNTLEDGYLLGKVDSEKGMQATMLLK